MAIKNDVGPTNPCVGCGGEGAFDGLIWVCSACAAEVVKIFGDEAGPIPAGGIEIEEGNASRVADAILAAMGLGRDS